MNNQELQTKLKSKILSVFESAVLDIADDFQRSSPVGSTRGLINGWDVDVYPDNDGFKGTITNNSTASRYRALGRSPGKLPPIDPITDWVVAKGIEVDQKRARRIAFAIGKSIARKGTQRWSSNSNPFGLTREGKITVELKNKLVKNITKYWNQET